jgi:hypothetical protein
MGVHGDMVSKRYAGTVKDVEAPVERDPTLPDYDESGVDLSLIRWMLSLTPAERLRFAQECINNVLAIQALNGTK